MKNLDKFSMLSSSADSIGHIPLMVSDIYLLNYSNCRSSSMTQLYPVLHQRNRVKTNDYIIMLFTCKKSVVMVTFLSNQCIIQKIYVIF